MCRVRNRFLRRSVLEFSFLGLGVWVDGLFSLAVPFFFFVVVVFLSPTWSFGFAVSLASMLKR